MILELLLIREVSSGQSFIIELRFPVKLSSWISDISSVFYAKNEKFWFWPRGVFLWNHPLLISRDISNIDTYSQSNNNICIIDTVEDIDDINNICIINNINTVSI